MKGLVFAGCSFTWGQGLYYYSKLDTLKEPAPDQYDGNLVTDAHKRYGATIRYPRLVANHFDTFEVVSLQNGGSEHQSVLFLEQIFGEIDNCDYFSRDKFDYSEIEYVIIQTSQPPRNDYHFVKNGVSKIYNYHQPEGKGDFYEWLVKEKKWGWEEWFQDHLTKTIVTIKKKMMFLESKGIKTKILCWEDDYLSLIKDDIWLYNRFIPLTYGENTYNDIKTLQTEHRDCVIKFDYENFDEKPPQDHHPSRKCHQIISENVINSLKYDQYKKIRVMSTDPKVMKGKKISVISTEPKVMKKNGKRLI